ncbi:efflux RND transporter periplasmic adaptor subunit [Candidatus Peregrinibacteria bacterium]|nr:efflux RND transporter periplasmic adaptor subunit [Candidatus Peregrinibacteria bacterium]
MNTIFDQFFSSIKGIARILRRRWKLTLSVLLVGIPLLLLVKFLATETPPEYVLGKARRGTLTQTVEAVGTVISEKDLELKFPVSGIVEEVFVDEGSVVIAGQVLAKLRSGSVHASVVSASARLTTALAELKALEEGSRPEDIAIAEAEVENKRAALAYTESKMETAIASLEKAKQKLVLLRDEARINLTGEVTTAGSTAEKQLTIAQTSIGVIDGVFLDVTLENILVQQQPYAYSELESNLMKIRRDVQAASALSYSPKNYREAADALTAARFAVSGTANIVQRSYDFILSLEPLALFSSAKKENLKSTLATEKKNMHSALSDIDAAMQSLHDASAVYDTKIAAEESALITAQGARDQAEADIQTYQTSLRISEAQLNLKKAGTRKSDIDAARGRVQQARGDLLKAQSDEDDTVLKAPIDGTITKVNLKQGEFTPGQFSETGPAMTILGSSPYRLEVYVSEIDIPKVRTSQSGSILLDAFPGTPFALRVSEIDPAATIADGVPKYRIVLDFLKPDEAFKIGMTGDTDIITSVKEDTIFVPARSVVKDEQGEIIVRVPDAKNGSRDIRVVTGMETVDDIEIVSGIAEGQDVIVLIKQ